MEGSHEHTVRYKPADQHDDFHALIVHVYRALEQKGYDPSSQIAGYLMSGDPTYITSHLGARDIMRQLDRSVLLEQLVDAFVYQKPLPQVDSHESARP